MANVSEIKMFDIVKYGNKCVFWEWGGVTIMMIINLYSTF